MKVNTLTLQRQIWALDDEQQQQHAELHEFICELQQKQLDMRAARDALIDAHFPSSVMAAARWKARFEAVAEVTQFLNICKMPHS